MSNLTVAWDVNWVAGGWKLREGTKLGEKESLRVWDSGRMGERGILTVWERGGTGGAGYTQRGTERPNVPTFDTKLHQTSFPQALLHLVHGDVKKTMQFLDTPSSPFSLLFNSCCGENRSKSTVIVIIRTCQNTQDPSFWLLLKPGCG